MQTIVQITDLTKTFKKQKAVDNVTINVNKGDIYGFIGENGAGKTTIMKMITGLHSPTSGEIKLFGNTDLKQGRRKIGATIENPALYLHMTAYENMEVQRLMLGIEDKEKCTEILQLAGMSDTGNKKAKNFSLGMKQRLMIALALLGDPELLILDEPTNGLDPMGIKEMRDFLQELNQKRGITIFISSHILGELQKITTRYGIITKGVMLAEFDAHELETMGVTDLEDYYLELMYRHRYEKEGVTYA